MKNNGSRMNDIYVKFPIFANAKHKGKRYRLFSMLMNLDNSSHKGLWSKLDVLPFEWTYTNAYNTIKGRGPFHYPNPGSREPFSRVV